MPLRLLPLLLHRLPWRGQPEVGQLLVAKRGLVAMLQQVDLQV